VSRGRLTENVSHLPGLVAERDGRPAGFALVRVDGGEAEIAAIRALDQRRGVGTALLEAVEAERDRAGWQRLRLVTTNDNVDAIRFYQRRGWEWVAFHHDAVTAARELKPEIPTHGAHGIRIRHELEFEAPKRR
jgi:ribosomal protein S18 acetylase RimI-like enzyme